MPKNQNYQNLKKFSLSLELDLFGVADVSGIKEEFVLSQNSLRGLNRGISLGVRLSAEILSEIENAPTKLYFHHYRSINIFLDQAALRIANYIQRKGLRALPIPASQILDWQAQKAHLSHKKVGYLAGLGWLGRNNLLVNKKLGCQFRLVTILTDMPLPPDRPIKEDCGACSVCIKICPSGAIKDKSVDFDHLACFEKLKEFQKQRLVDQYICGVCVSACRGKAT